MPTVTSTQIFQISASGYVSVYDADDTFSAIRSDSANFVDQSNLMLVSLVSSTTSNHFSALTRGIQLFDTSTLPANATIIAATLTIPPVAINNTSLDSNTLELVSSNPADNTTLITSDYSSLGSTSFGSISQASLSTSTKNVFTLNSSGLTNINIGGISKFGFRLGWDLSGTFGGTWASGIATTIDWLKPNTFLTITYTQPTTALTGISKLKGVSKITTSGE
jgi:hypothetical protein